METDKLRQLIEDQLRASRRLKARIAELEGCLRAPLAVVGVALRLPGGITTPQQYWDLLTSPDTGTEADSLVREIPPDRPRLRDTYDPRPGTPGRSHVNRAAFLDDIASFDAALFGISQLEARSLDPQQRLLLETAWEALERAGLAARRQDRLPVGVFIGMMAAEYGKRLTPGGDLTGIDPYYASGSGQCFAAGRISYALGLCGPALSVDTACSSSLVALHLAAQSLRSGACRYALAGGANLVLGPELMVALSQSQALAPDGRCKTFQAGADGYGRGEGVGMIALMRLADAQAEGRPVLAVLRGSAVNHDGASSGLTVPNGPAQQEVIRAALDDAGVGAADVGYVETHGTGTSLGDPIEAGALDSVVGTGAGQRAAPVAIGSVKSRIGHLEAAAGIAAVIKVTLMLQRGVIPAAMPAAGAELNQLIPWDRIALTVPASARPWPAELPRKVAGVSAFGLSGTNAHVVLEAYQPEPASEENTSGHNAGRDPAQPAGTGRPELLTLSAKTPAALTELAIAVRDRLADLPAAQLPAACHTLRAGRVHFANRIAVTGASPAELVAALMAVLAEPPQQAALPRNQRAELHATPEGAAAVADALAVAHPALAQSDPAADPVTRLRAILAALGIRTRQPRPSAGDPPAELRVGALALPLTCGTPGDAARLLAGALAALYRGGMDLRLGLLAAPGTTFTPDLPTYPFQRKRFWIDEDPGGPRAAGPEQQPAPGQQTTGQHTTGQPPAAPRRGALSTCAVSGFLVAELGRILKSDTDLDLQEPVLDIGGDSFTASLLAKSIERHYGLALPADDFPVELPVGEFAEHLTTQIMQLADAGQEAAG